MKDSCKSFTSIFITSEVVGPRDLLERLICLGTTGYHLHITHSLLKQKHNSETLKYELNNDIVSDTIGPSGVSLRRIHGALTRYPD